MVHEVRTPRPGDRVRIRDAGTGDLFEVELRHYEYAVNSHRIITSSGREFVGSPRTLSIEVLSRPLMPWGVGFSAIAVVDQGVYPDSDPEDEESIEWAQRVMEHLYSPGLYTPGRDVGSWVTSCDLDLARPLSYEVKSEDFLAWRLWSLPRDAALEVVRESGRQILEPLYGGPGVWKAGWTAPKDSLFASHGPWNYQWGLALNMVRHNAGGVYDAFGQDWEALESRIALRESPLCRHG